MNMHSSNNFKETGKNYYGKYYHSNTNFNHGSNSNSNSNSNPNPNTNPYNNYKGFIGLEFNPDGSLNEFGNIPGSIDLAVKLKRNLTLKQITSIMEHDGMSLNGLCGEMFNVIHDRIQLKVRRHFIKINHKHRTFCVSLYNWYDLQKIEKMIVEMVFGDGE